MSTFRHAAISDSMYCKSRRSSFLLIHAFIPTARQSAGSTDCSSAATDGREKNVATTTESCALMRFTKHMYDEFPPHTVFVTLKGAQLGGILVTLRGAQFGEIDQGLSSPRAFVRRNTRNNSRPRYIYVYIVPGTVDPVACGALRALARGLLSQTKLKQRLLQNR